jgi:hypothetical protein
MLNPFASDAYSVAALTLAINKFPVQYGLLNQLGIFPEEGVRQRTVLIEQRNNVLTLLPTRPVGSPGTLGNIGKREVRSFVIPQIPHDDAVLPEEVQGIRAFGSENETDTVAALMARKLQTMKNRHDITLEHLRAGALQGTIKDADGSTIYNLFTEFGITQTVEDFAFGTATTDVAGRIRAVKRDIEKALQGEVSTGVLFLCSDAWYDAFVKHDSVKDAFKYYQVNGQNLAGDYRGFDAAGLRIGNPFSFGEAVFINYSGFAKDTAGNTRYFIPQNEAIAFPLGTQQTFRTYFAPADFNETANTIGLPLYAKQEERKFQRGWDIHTQSNPLPLCARPEVLIRVTKS